MLLRILLPVVGLALSPACSPAKNVSVDDAWVRMAAAPGRPAGGYFSIRGGATDQTLVKVSTPAAGRVEMHETVKDGPGMTMRPVGEVRVPAGATVSFAPGGKHLMLFDVVPGAGSKPIPLTFTFADGRTLTVQAKTIAAGDPAPAP